jgi:hypothetical protein
VRFHLLILLLCVVVQVSAHPGHEEPEPDSVVSESTPVIKGRVAEWTFQPHYRLPRGNRLEATAPSDTQTPFFSERLAAPRLFTGEAPSDRFRNALSVEKLPRGDFSIEIWATYHVNEKVGGAVMAYDANSNSQPHWLLGFMGGEVYFSFDDVVLTEPQLEIKASVEPQDLESGEYARGAERYWHHLVGVKQEDVLTLYHNGTVAAQLSLGSKNESTYLDGTEFEIAAYLENEPHMELGNLIRYASLYDRALTEKDINAVFDGHRELVEHGVHQRGVFHFTTGGPHLAVSTKNDIHITWEADRPHSAIIEWGATAELGEQIKLIDDGSRMKKGRIAGLQSNSSYFHRVTAIDQSGQQIQSGLQMCRTAIEKGDPFVFAAISDTEARPHVNAKIGDLVWRESPHFMINAGDLTDGGRHDHRVEWTHEYFASMAQLMARLPVLPVMGNGENDFVWFDRYHHTPGEGISYYQYSYGDVDVFVLDSNLERHDKELPGFREAQRSWFENALKNSKAKWKVATHHHPPLQNRYPDVVSDFVPLYEQYDVDLVLVGHHHNYRRSWPLTSDLPDFADGIVYIQLGGGGGNVSARPDTPDLRWAKTFQGYGYSLFSVADNTMYIAMYDDNGAMRDQFTLVKSGPSRARLGGR